MAENWNEVFATWNGDSTFIGENNDGGSVQMGMLGNTTGISPMQLVLVGLAGCTGVDVVSILKKKRAHLSGFKVHVRGKRTQKYPRVYAEIQGKYLLWGEGLKAKDVEKAIQLSEEKYCSVSSMLGKTARIHSSYKIFNPDEPEILGE